jgi:hypothetical protein
MSSLQASGSCWHPTLHVCLPMRGFCRVALLSSHCFGLQAAYICAVVMQRSLLFNACRLSLLVMI